MLLIVLLAINLASAEAPKTGTFKLTFRERHPESSFERMRLRYGWDKPKQTSLYDITSEEFDVHVPSNYDGTTPYGLIVYTNAGKGGGAGMYSELMAKYRLIWIGAANVPNERDVAPRWGLSLDAVWNMCKLYKIDPRRIYASGMSGGGRCASMVAPTYADVFTGALYLVGCNDPVFPPEKVVGKPIRELALANRYALMTGGTDMNKPGTKALFDSMKSLGFKRVAYFEQPDLGHAVPASEWFEKGLQSVDKPLLDEAAALLAQGKAAETKKPYEACRAYRTVANEYAVAVESAATAKERFTALAPAADVVLRTDLAKLATASGDKLRAFVERAAGFPCESAARTQAEAAGAKELESILTQPAAAKLEKFIATWAGYACVDKATEAYEALAAKALEPLAAQAAGKRGKALVKFLKDWQPCSSRNKADELLESDLTAELATIQAIDKVPARSAKLQAFAKAWPGTKAASRAESEVKTLLNAQ